SQHLAAAQHQQPQGFPNQQAIKMPFNPFQSSQFAQNPGHQLNQPRAIQKRKVFDLIPIPYSQLLPYLVHNGMLTPIALRPMTAPFLLGTTQRPSANTMLALKATPQTTVERSKRKYKSSSMGNF
ncbi:hypothetical protein A2U01_0056824, partial [Trifolium medium]|nr:hypothetical protein [Trifolium medium]